ncbi:MAG TPA: hypothetical protein ENJ00_06515, partial [Phycisphaerales bacterium]|nr:hypothetical protein [Phycisphaerales bacterium]
MIALLIACFVGVMVLPGESEHPIQDEPAPHMLAEAPASSEEIAPVSADVSLSTDKAEVPTSQPPPSEIPKPATQQSEDAPIPAATDQAEPPTGPELPIITDASPSAQKLDKPDDDQETPGQTPADQATSEKPSGWAALTRVAPAPTEETGLSVRVRDDGSLEIGDRFVIQGKGTPDKPYE